MKLLIFIVFFVNALVAVGQSKNNTAFDNKVTLSMLIGKIWNSGSTIFYIDGFNTLYIKSEFKKVKKYLTYPAPLDGYLFFKDDEDGSTNTAYALMYINSIDNSSSGIQSIGVQLGYASTQTEMFKLVTDKSNFRTETPIQKFRTPPATGVPIYCSKHKPKDCATSAEGRGLFTQLRHCVWP